MLSATVNYFWMFISWLIGGYLPMLQRCHFSCCTTEPFNGIFVYCTINLIRTRAWSCKFESRWDNWSSQSVWLGWYCLDSRSHRQAIQLTLMLWLRSWTDIPSLSLLSFSIYTLCFSAHFDSYTLCYLLGYVVYTFVSLALFLFTICFLHEYFFVYALCFSTNLRSEGIYVPPTPNRMMSATSNYFWMFISWHSLVTFQCCKILQDRLWGSLHFALSV